MNFYIDSGGTIIAVDPERVYQGSAMANTIRLIAPFPLGASVTVSYILPDGTQMQPQLMTANKTLSGVQTETGVNFSVWEQNIGVRFEQVNGAAKAVPDFTVLSQVGKVGVVFTITQANAAGQPIKQTTARSSFLCERGAPLVMPPEAFDDYESLLNQILGKLSVAVQDDIYLEQAIQDVEASIEEVDQKYEQSVTELEDGKVNRSGDTMTGALNIEEGGRFASYEADGINVDGEKMFFPEESGTLVTNKELAAVADNISKAMTEQADTLASGLVGSITMDFAESSNNLIVELFNGKNQTKDIITVNLPFSLYALKSAAVANVEMYLDQTNYVLSLVARNANNETISSSSVDFPVESMVVNARFDEATQELVLVLKNGNETRVPIGDIVSGLIPSSEKGAPNGVATLDNAGTITDAQIPNSIGRGGTCYKVPMDLTETYLNVPVGYWTSVHGRLPRHGDFVLSANGSICRVTSSSETAVTLEYLFNYKSKGTTVTVDGIAQETWDADTKVGFDDYASTKQHGVIKTYKGFGVMTNPGGYAYIDVASKDDIDKRNSSSAEYAYMPIGLKVLDYAWKVAATTNTETWTDEEKAAACETIGAMAKKTNTSSVSQVYAKSANGSQFMVNMTPNADNNTVPMRENGNFYVVNVRDDNHCANKKYVKGLPDNLTLTAEEQAGWRGMIGATKLYKHTLYSENDNFRYTDREEDSPFDKLVIINNSPTALTTGSQVDWQTILSAIEGAVRAFYIADDYTVISNIIEVDMSGFCTVSIGKVLEEISFNSSHGNSLIELTDTVEEY